MATLLKKSQIQFNMIDLGMHDPETFSLEECFADYKAFKQFIKEYRDCIAFEIQIGKKRKYEFWKVDEVNEYLLTSSIDGYIGLVFDMINKIGRKCTIRMEKLKWDDGIYNYNWEDVEETYVVASGKFEYGTFIGTVELPSYFE